MNTTVGESCSNCFGMFYPFSSQKPQQRTTQTLISVVVLWSASTVQVLVAPEWATGHLIPQPGSNSVSPLEKSLWPHLTQAGNDFRQGSFLLSFGSSGTQGQAAAGAPRLSVVAEGVVNSAVVNYCGAQEAQMVVLGPYRTATGRGGK